MFRDNFNFNCNFAKLTVKLIGRTDFTYNKIFVRKNSQSAVFV